jgi:hypothetical protein
MYHAHWTGKEEFEDTKELINPRRVDNSKRKRTKNNPQNTTQKLKLKIEQHEPGVKKCTVSNIDMSLFYFQKNTTKTA